MKKDYSPVTECACVNKCFALLLLCLKLHAVDADIQILEFGFPFFIQRKSAYAYIYAHIGLLYTQNIIIL